MMKRVTNQITTNILYENYQRLTTTICEKPGKVQADFNLSFIQLLLFVLLYYYSSSSSSQIRAKRERPGKISSNLIKITLIK